MPRKLSDAGVAEIRRSAAAGASPAALAMQFEVSRQHVCRLVLGQQRVTADSAGAAGEGPVSDAVEEFLSGLEADARTLVLAATVRAVAAKLDAMGASDAIAAAAAAERLSARLARLLGELESAGSVEGAGEWSPADVRELLRPIQGMGNGT